MSPLVLSASAASRLALDEPYVLISISSPDGEPITPGEDENRMGVLFLEFHDLIGAEVAGFESRHGFKPVLFSREHALQIKDFLASHRGVFLACNCEAGISRSAAVAAAVAKATGEDDSIYFRRYHPNPRVYRMTLEALYNGEKGEEGDASDHRV